MEDYVKFEQAKLLKGVGFDWDCMMGYAHYPNESVKTFNAQEENINGKYNKWCWSAPTLYQVQKWLFEKYGIWVEITRDTIETTRFDCGITHADDEYREWVGMFDNPIEALSSGIDKALQLIQKNKS